ncbi:clostripain-related cysteine peptidase [Oribacterium sp. WCC10]|uniref:clostripain-related cysteine peptidase n=1 Tax=Oribacterium sp. WCC10 TaxID=1855343 RepID=UPI0015878F9B|nr:clostripain-related cysteine peptidase [Oribacterium sp. WCC10]
MDTTKTRKIILTMIITAVVSSAVLSCISCSKNPASGTNEAVSSSKGTASADAKDTEGSFALLVYMIGSDLETFDAAASNDIQEMLGAASGDNLNIIIQTGGSKSWHLKEIENDGVGRYRIRNGKLETIELLDNVRMSESETLADFISWAGNNQTAERYGLVLWNHGGGTLVGYGLDEYYPDETMSIDQIHEALSDGGLHFDFIGFDACLMCTVETAMALAGHADYMIASEETEPSTGWYYTEWIKQLSERPGVSIPELGKTIIDSFVSGPDYNKYDFYTLSLVDLKKIEELYRTLSGYFKEEEKILNDQYQKTVVARANTKSFGNDGYEQIDLFDYLNSVEEETESGRAQKVLEKAKDAVCYFQGTVTGSNGIALYYPYLYPERFDQVMEMLYTLDYEESYFDFYRHFLNVLVKTRLNASEEDGGEKKAESNVKKIRDITVDTGVSEEDLLATSWYDPHTVLPENLLVPDVNVFEMVPKDNFGKYGLHLPEEQWDLISDIWVDYWLEMESGWLVDCGTDKYYEWDWDGDLTLDYDGKWLALNGEIVPYYLTGVVYGETFAEDYSFGYVPATLNDKGIKIQIVNDAESPYGRVVGYKYNYKDADSRSDDDPNVSAKGLHQFKDGDEIRTYYARYNNEDGIGTSTFDSLVYNGDPIIYNGDLEVSYEPFDRYNNRDIHVLVNFRFKDIYGNTYYTFAIDYKL